MIAWILVVLGVLRIAMGVFAVFSTIGIEIPAAFEGYLGAATSGDVIAQGMMFFVAGIVMGLLVQIAKGVKFD